MNKSLLIEGYIFNTLPLEEKLLVEVQIVTDSTFKDAINSQKLTYKVIEEFGRKQLRSEILEVENSLFNSAKYSSFKEKIFKLFNL